MIEKKDGFLKRRLVNNTRYSMQGLAATFRHEEAFKIEVILAIFLIPLGLYLGKTGAEKALLMGAVLVVLMVEILNSAIETLADRISEEKHALSGRAKDQGSAAVLLSLCLFVIIWGLILFY
jgi:diacylglycerol kinase (ATP)